MRKVYVVSGYGSRPIAAFDKREDALTLSDAIFGKDGEERVYETLFMRGESPSACFTVVGIGDRKDCDGDGNDE